jgi:glucokinase
MPARPPLLAIEIGGTKLQLAIGTPDGQVLAAVQRFPVDALRGARGILDQIAAAAAPLIAQHAPRAVGIGFGGPVDRRRGRVIKSHHVAGWEDFPLADWCREELLLPAVVGNDCDLAGLAEARLGAGRGVQAVFYVTVGTGIGGGFILHGQIYGEHSLAAAELGHLRPGLECGRPDQNLESLAAGWGIAQGVRQELSATPSPDAQALLTACGGDPRHLTAQHLAHAALRGNALALAAFDRATCALGWGIAQVITLLAPQVIVVGGGVALAGPALFLEPLRRAVARYVFAPLAGSYRIVSAELGEHVVLHGALLEAGTSLQA